MKVLHAVNAASHWQIKRCPITSQPTFSCFQRTSLTTSIATARADAPCHLPPNPTSCPMLRPPCLSLFPPPLVWQKSNSSLTQQPHLHNVATSLVPYLSLGPRTSQEANDRSLVIHFLKALQPPSAAPSKLCSPPVSNMHKFRFDSCPRTCFQRQPRCRRAAQGLPTLRLLARCLPRAQPACLRDALQLRAGSGRSRLTALPSSGTPTHSRHVSWHDPTRDQRPVCRLET